MCIICTGKIHNENLNTLLELNVSYCPNLTSEKLQEILIQCKNLKQLWCSYCKSLTSLDLRNNINLVTLLCYFTSLTSLDLRSSSEGVASFGCINLATLDCSNCTSLTSLDLRNNINLRILECSNCTSLTSLDLRSNIEIKYILFQYYKCPWITQYKDFSNNLQRLIKLQRWYRKLLLIRYMKSKQFIEWIYNPSNIGGKSHKLRLLKNFNITS